MKLLLSVLVVFLALPLQASDHSNVSHPSRHRAGALQHEGGSPFPPPDAEDTLFVVDSGGDLDTDCTYHSNGPLVIHLPVTRYVGKIKADGTLDRPSDLTNQGFLSERARLRLPAFDVDVFGDPTDSTVPPELDRVRFNGHDLGSLTGDDDIWKLNEFDIPIEWVKFPAPGKGGAPPTPADNVIEIEIDTLSGGDDTWCTAVDWVELDFGAIAPIFLVHGIFASGSSAWQHFHDRFTAAGIPFSDDINLSPVGSIDLNAFLLADQLRALARSFGAKKCHIIAHSKGGLDTRGYLNGDYDAGSLQVLSLYTLSTPHHGTILADVGVLAEAVASINSPAARLLPILFPFVSDLSTMSTANFNRRFGSVPAGISVYCYGADADANRDRFITGGEAAELQGAFLAPVWATIFYNIVGNSAPVKVTFGTQTVRTWGDTSFTAVDIQVTQPFADNDVLVPTTSAAAPFGTYVRSLSGNHTSMKSTDLAEEILKRIVAEYPAR